MFCRQILKKIKAITDRINEEDFRKFINEIKKAPRIYIIGYGRSGLVARAFAMRLVHLRKKVFVIGETVTPAMRAGDVLLAVSGSGETPMVVEVARAAKRLKGRIIAVTKRKKSPLSDLSDLCVIIPTPETLKSADHYEVRELAGFPSPPLGSLFEISALIFFEACVVALMIELGIKEEEMREIHANL